MGCPVHSPSVSSQSWRIFQRSAFKDMQPGLVVGPVPHQLRDDGAQGPLKARFPLGERD
jgi:hypothetical protein